MLHSTLKIISIFAVLINGLTIERLPGTEEYQLRYRVIGEESEVVNNDQFFFASNCKHQPHVKHLVPLPVLSWKFADMNQYLIVVNLNKSSLPQCENMIFYYGKWQGQFQANEGVDIDENGNVTTHNVLTGIQELEKLLEEHDEGRTTPDYTAEMESRRGVVLNDDEDLCEIITV